MKKTGQILKETRESKGISLQEASLHLKISTKILKAMEEGDLNALPAKTFIRGFVQSYAQFLRYDPKKALDLFQDEMGTTHPGMVTSQVTTSEVTVTAPTSNSSSSTNNTKPEPSAKKSDPVSAKIPPLAVDPHAWSLYTKLSIAFIIIGIVILIVFIKRTIDRYERESQISQIAADTIKPIETSPDSLVVTTPPGAQPEMAAGETSPPSSQMTTSSQPTPTTTTQDTKAQAPQAAPVVSPTPAPAAAPTATGATVAKPTSAPAPAATPAPTPQPAAPKPPVPAPSSAVTTPATPSAQPPATPALPPQEIIVEALDKVTIEYTIDGTNKSSVSLKPEQVHTFKAKEKMSLVFSDGGAVNIIHNGKDRGVPGNLGQPLKVTYP